MCPPRTGACAPSLADPHFAGICPHDGNTVYSVTEIMGSFSMARRKKPSAAGTFYDNAPLFGLERDGTAKLGGL